MLAVFLADSASLTMCVVPQRLGGRFACVDDKLLI